LGAVKRTEGVVVEGEFGEGEEWYWKEEGEEGESWTTSERARTGECVVDESIIIDSQPTMASP
jgi:hypothetical protein